MRRKAPCLLALMLVLSAKQEGLSASYVYQEPLGAANPYQLVVAPIQYAGVRFQLNEPTQLTSLHTVFGYSDSTFFAALVTLPGIDGLPQGDPFNPGEVIYSTVFQSLSLDRPVPIDIPFNVTVGPGAYGVVLGGGQFGSDGSVWGGVDTYEGVSGSTEFFWTAGNPRISRGWHDESGVSEPITILLDVEGSVVPEPSTGALIVLGGVAGAWVRFRKA